MINTFNLETTKMKSQVEFIPLTAKYALNPPKKLLFSHLEKNEKLLTSQDAATRHEYYEEIILPWYTDAEDGEVLPLKKDSQERVIFDWALLCQEPLDVLQSLLNNQIKRTIEINEANRSRANYPNIVGTSVASEALVTAARSKYDEAIKWLLDVFPQIDLQRRRQQDRTALYTAAECGAETIVRFLLEAGALTPKEDSFNVHSMEYYNPLYPAILGGYLTIVEQLLNAGANIEKGTPLIWAIEHQQEEIALVLLKKNPAVLKKNCLSSVDKHFTTYLLKACQYGLFTVVTELLHYNVLVDLANDKGETPLCLAARGGFLPIVTLLLEKKASPSPKSCSPLSEACQYGHSEVVFELLKAGAIPTTLDVINVRGKKFTAIEHALCEVLLKLYIIQREKGPEYKTAGGRFFGFSKAKKLAAAKAAQDFVEHHTPIEDKHLKVLKNKELGFIFKGLNFGLEDNNDLNISPAYRG